MPSLVIVDKQDHKITADKMLDGEFGRLIAGNAEHIGCVVYRYKDDLINLTSGYNHSWSAFFKGRENMGPSILIIEPLRPGTTLKIEV